MKTIIKLLIILSFNLNLFAGGIPTIDVAAIAQAVKNYIDNIKEYAQTANRWLKTAQHYRDELEHYALEIKNTTGISDIVSAVNSAEGLYDELNQARENSLTLKSMLKEDLSSNGAILRAKELSNQFLLSDYCSSYESKNKQEVCYKNVRTTFQNENELSQIDKEFKNTFKEIASLSNKAKKANTMKEAADTTNALAVSQLKLQAQEQQLKLLAQKQNASKLSDELLKENLRVEYVKRQTNPNNAKFITKYKIADVRFGK